jgi:hypothetical protein
MLTALGRLRQEALVFEVNLGLYSDTLSQNKQTTLVHFYEVHSS